jgi:hypothetical protein
MQGPDYKKKYLELRAKYIGDVDIAFRLGFEAGGQQSQQQQALEAEAQVNEQRHQVNMAQEGGMGQEPSSETNGISQEADQTEQANPAGDIQNEQNGSELDQHIGKLESMLGNNKDPEVQKSLNHIVSLRKSEKQAVEMKKSQTAIPGIIKALHKPAFKIGVQASHNLNDNAKKSVSMQHKIVTDIMKAWSSEENKAKNSIENILNIEGLLNKE